MNSNELTADKIAAYSRGYHGTVHGDDSTGAVDVEFPTVRYAADFALVIMEVYGWKADIRSGDALTSIWDTVVLTITQPEKS